MVELYSNEYFALCGLGGILSCGVTHTAVTALDFVKCNVQANPHIFKNTVDGFKKTMAVRGFGGLYTGWAPTLVGYSVQGLFKFGLYEFFKHKYAGMVSEETAHKYRSAIYMCSSASAEFFADIGLAPWEATKVRVQTSINPKTLQPEFAKGLSDGFPKLLKQEGFGGLYKGLVPLWFRQIPYTVIKFVGFERAVELIYANLPKKKEEYGKGGQLLVSFGGGYLAGIFCAAVSHPADTIVSILNKDKTASIGKILKTTPAKDLMFKGLGTRIVMIGTLTGLQWLIYDTFKTMAGFPTTGGAKK